VGRPPQRHHHRGARLFHSAGGHPAVQIFGPVVVEGAEGETALIDIAAFDRFDGGPGGRGIRRVDVALQAGLVAPQLKSSGGGAPHHVVRIVIQNEADVPPPFASVSSNAPGAIFSRNRMKEGPVGLDSECI
jgi:hypothetical protein